jgi:hypothetical protein
LIPVPPAPACLLQRLHAKPLALPGLRGGADDILRARRGAEHLDAPEIV